MQVIVSLLAEGREIPEALQRLLPLEALQLLDAIVKQLYAQGLAGPNHRASERMKVIQHMINQRNLNPTKPKGADDILLSMGPEVSEPVLAQERQLITQSEAMGAAAAERLLAADRNPKLTL